MTHVLISVARTVQTLEIVAAAGAIRLSELSTALGTSRPGAFRIAQSLVALHWLSQGSDRRYRIGPGVRALGPERRAPTPPSP
ncbi:helix-turn-helix domain-containing protein [Cellulosimicrobium sp. CUA-896]|uniref:helix-turn-helix domain-containing protein n=1 Tax=Cellulosimicrobium sp. CUA-896 TaxID=1517881 RepID=UPI00095A5ADE|nr:helix-turn-helix domain-containing protein [Cellulosimicrobium sp. CUA-896]OLT52249.1 hypothetical protein BJF88_14230 [Cellulosimicrobium sp. CUA-896]